MKLILVIIFIFIISISTFSQKLTNPKLLGTWIAGEDPSEFVYHRVLEASLEYVKDNPNGKLIIRICSPDEFSTAFIKAQLNPLNVTTYGFYSLLTPQRFYITRSSKCLYKGKFNVTEYWFASGGKNIEHEEIFPLENIYYKDFQTYEFEKTDTKKLNTEFEKNLKSFIGELKNNPKSKGFIVHNSKNGKMKRNIENVLTTAKREGIDIGRIKTVVKANIDVNEKGELYQFKNEKKSFPNLVVIEIKK